MALNGLRATRCFAGTVDEIRGSYALISDAFPIKQQDRYMTRDPDGRATAFLVVVRTNGRHAVARIESGSPKAGQETALLHEEIEVRVEPDTWPDSAWTFGFSVGRATTTISVAAPDPSVASTNIDLKGTTVSGSVGNLFKVADWITAEGLAGYRSISTELNAGSAICGGTTNCTFRYGLVDLGTKVSLFPFPAWALRPFFGAGIDIAYPVDKASSAVDTSVLHLVFFEQVTAGLQLHWNNEHYIRLAAEYGTLASTSSVKIFFNEVRLDHGWTW